MVYKEIQKFRQPWIWILLTTSGLFISVMFGVGINKQVMHGQKFGNHPLSDPGLIVMFVSVMLLFVLIALMFGFAKLTTLIDDKGIAWRFFPFQFKFRRVDWDKLDSFEVISYNPIRDYGGWGIRTNKTGKAYNVFGDKGLQLRLKNGEKVLIGTQNPNKLNDCLSSFGFLQ
ncbi:MAG: hypothetical protein NTW16_09425 [Bacteroidetes bacterium]|nr:hypothetical protein [Bacteroidota bacterium]